MKKINSIEFDTHWFRRVFHTFAASFLIYYMLPDDQLLKVYISIAIFMLVFILEFFRINGIIKSSNFFGLRTYEKKRPASYLYFGAALLLLLLFFPQQIAIPCILCACFSDPIIGELRHHLGKKEAYLIGFFVCMFFFAITWFKADIWILFTVSIIGATGALIGEVKKFLWLDDDFMIQMLPAILILLLLFVAKSIEIDILPETLIHPGLMIW